MSLEKVLYEASQPPGGVMAAPPAMTASCPSNSPPPRPWAGRRGTNPEQLFAAGYSTCFLGALKLVAGKAKVSLPNWLYRSGGIGPLVGSAFRPPNVNLPAGSGAGKTLVEKAHQVCLLQCHPRQY